MNKETSNGEAGRLLSCSALLGGVAAKKLDFLTDRGAKVVCVKVYFEMPNGDEGMVDSWGRVDWNGIRPGILAREVAEIEPPNAELSEPGGPAASESTERVAPPGFAPVIGSGAVSEAQKKD